MAVWGLWRVAVVFIGEDLDEEAEKRGEPVAETEDHADINDAAPWLRGELHQNNQQDDAYSEAGGNDACFLGRVEIAHAE